MFRNRAGAATLSAALSALALLSATGAGAWPFGSQKSAAAAKPSADAEEPAKAGPDQRAAAVRQPPLVRASFWQRELTLDPKDLEAGLGLAQALRALGKTDEAADVADRMLTIAPKSLELLIESGRDHIAGGHGFYALAPLKDAMRLAPKDWRPVSLIAIAYDQDERPQDALSSFEAALKLSKDNPAVLSNLALFKAARGDMASAERLLRQAVAQPKAAAQERQNLALVLGLEGKTAEAETWMRQDLPPEAAAANLAYLQGPKGAPSRSPAQPRAIAPGGADPQAWSSGKTAPPGG